MINKLGMPWALLLFVYLAQFSLFAKAQNVVEIEAQTNNPKPNEYSFESFKEQPTLRHFKVTPTVNVITGEYLTEACDLVIAGSDPISFRRFYGSFSSYNQGSSFWRFNPEQYCVANFEYKEMPLFLSIGNEEGNIAYLDGQTGFKFDNLGGFSHNAITGQNHPSNISISYQKTAPENDGKYRWVAEIKSGNGSVRQVQTLSFNWNSSLRKRKSEDDGYEYLEPSEWTPYDVAVLEERKPNGNIVEYTYDCNVRTWGFKNKIPSYNLLKSITLYNSTRTKKLGSLILEYSRDNTKECKIKGSDGRIAILKFGTLHFKDHDLIFLSDVESPNEPIVHYKHNNKPNKRDKEKSFGKIEWPDGRVFETLYNSQNGKVTSQLAPIGPKGELETLYKYDYYDQSTVVTDSIGNRTVYYFDDKKRIVRIELYEKEKILRVDRFTINQVTGDLCVHRIEDETGKALQVHEYFHDANHNAYAEKIGDDKEQYAIKRTFSNDGFNLVTSEFDNFGKKVLYEYKPGTNLCTLVESYYHGKLKSRLKKSYDDCAICIRTEIEDGEGSYKKVTEIIPRYQQPCFGLPETVIEKTSNDIGNEVQLSRVVYSYTHFGKVGKEDHYGSDDRFLYSVFNFYDERERLKQTINPLGHSTFYRYDANNNLIEISGPMPGQKKEIDYDKMNRPVLFREYVDGVCLTLERVYDSLGRVIKSKDECGNWTEYGYNALDQQILIVHPDGVTEQKKYDILGNVILERDGNGEEIRKRYNYRNQVKEVYYPDGSEEHFSYLPNGDLLLHHDKNGAIIEYEVDFFGKPKKIKYLSSTGQLLKEQSAGYALYGKIWEKDGEGIETRFSYDKSGRKIKEEKDNRIILYDYDSAGNVALIRDGILNVYKEYDNLGHLVEETSKSASDQILRKVAYKYDECGNQTEIITSKGTFTSIFNTIGLPTKKIDPLGNTTRFDYFYGKPFIQFETNPKGIKKYIFFDCHSRQSNIVVKNAKEEILQHKELYYDNGGNLEYEKDNLYDGNKLLTTTVIERKYWPGKHLRKLIEEEGKETTFFYDKRGRLALTIKPNKKFITNKYDDLGRLVRLKTSDLEYHYTYDKNDHVKKIKDVNSQQCVTREYNRLGQITREKGPFSKITFDYDSFGRRKKTILSNDTEIEYDYEGDQLSSIKRGKYEYRYLDRDLEGKPNLIQMPGTLGKINIQLDPLNRWNNFDCKYYKLAFPSDAYDSCGNLSSYSYSFKNQYKKMDFFYDDLQQLIKENTHLYAFDSLHHRIRKDGQEEKCNRLGQITEDAAVTYQYDKCGNLKSDGKCIFEYDTLDRLIKVLNGDDTFEYGYDGFHRRIVKKKNGRVQEYYIWDGENEIGSMTEEGKIKELRVLGEGKGAEIGAAVLIELNDKTYVPIHDHTGSLVVLIDLLTNEAVEENNYSAFGECYPNKSRLSPWTYCSKREDPETRFIYFGRRYYMPNLGRWLTPDPKGFHDGTNLYAYVHNNPFSYVDLYGLKGILNDLFDSWKHKHNETQKHCRCRHWYPEYERRARSNSCTIVIPGIKPENFGIHLAVGNWNNCEDGHKSGERTSELLGGLEVRVNLHQTQGTFNDIIEAIAEIFFGKMTTSCIILWQNVNNYFRENPNNYYLIYAHSKGAADVRNVLRHTPQWMRERIVVIAIAPAAYISDNQAMLVRHSRSKNDIVPMLDFIGRMKNEHTTTVMEPLGNEFFDHSYSSKTYDKSILDGYSLMIHQVGLKCIN